jgi:hypothetical protein
VSDAIPSPTAASKVCHVISVPESDLGPHFLNGRKDIYVRSDEFSSRFEAQLANDTELRHLLQRRHLVTERRVELLHRARQRFEVFTKQKYSELGKGTKQDGIGARFDLCIAPRFPARPICDHARPRESRLPLLGTASRLHEARGWMLDERGYRGPLTLI